MLCLAASHLWISWSRSGVLLGGLLGGPLLDELGGLAVRQNQNGGTGDCTSCGSSGVEGGDGEGLGEGQSQGVVVDRGRR